MPEGTQEGNKPQAPKLHPLRKPLSVTALCVMGLFILAVFYTFYLAREFFLPVTMAWILSALLKPALRLMTRLRIPEALGAAILLLILVAVLVSGVVLLSGPASDWLGRAPESLEKVERKIRSVLNSAQPIASAAKSVEQLTNGGGSETPKVMI